VIQPVDLWTIRLTRPHAYLLSEDEQLRANRFRFEADRIRWTRARSALRQVLATYTGNPSNEIGFSRGEHGKPELFPASGIQFNLSHAGDFAMIAVSRSTPVGVDIERIRPEIDIAALLRRLGETGLPVTEAELYRRWTAREARSKAAGTGLMTQPPASVTATDVEAPPGYVASVAVSGSPDIIVNYRIPACGG
jgi:4'-phosphopantetheinyl transferase